MFPMAPILMRAVMAVMLLPPWIAPRASAHPWWAASGAPQGAPQGGGDPNGGSPRQELHGPRRPRGRQLINPSGSPSGIACPANGSPSSSSSLAKALEASNSSVSVFVSASSGLSYRSNHSGRRNPPNPRLPISLTPATVGPPLVSRLLSTHLSRFRLSPSHTSLSSIAIAISRYILLK